MTRSTLSISSQSDDDSLKVNNNVTIKQIEYLGDMTLQTSQQIEQGLPISFRKHIQDILEHYDIIEVPKSFLEGILIPEEGKFFLVQPENPEEFWSARMQQ